MQEPTPEVTLLSAPVEHLGLRSPGEPLPHQLGQQHGQVGGHREPGPHPGLLSPLQLHGYQGLGSPWLHNGPPPSELHGLHLAVGLQALPGPSWDHSQSPGTSGGDSRASWRVSGRPGGGLWGRELSRPVKTWPPGRKGLLVSSSPGPEDHLPSTAQS